jgi:hypothetical protein
MLEDYHKVSYPSFIGEYAGPFVSCFYFSGLVFCLYKIVRAEEMRRSIQLVLMMCCVMLAADSLFWLDYYAGYPLWFYGALEFSHMGFEVSVIERLASSWLTIFRRHSCLIAGQDTYSKGLQRVSLTLSVAFQVSSVTLFVVLFLLKSSLLRLVLRLYITAVELLYFLPYLIYASWRLNSIIRQYLDSSFTTRMNLITIMSFVCIFLRVVVLLYCEFETLNSSFWFSLVLFVLMFGLDFGFLLTIFAVILRKSKGNPDQSGGLIANLSVKDEEPTEEFEGQSEANYN